MRPVITAFIFMVMVAIALIYIKDFGWEAFERDMLRSFMSFLAIALASGLLADILKEARE